MKSKRNYKPALGAEFALVSRRNRVSLDRKKEAARRECRKSKRGGRYGD